LWRVLPRPQHTTKAEPLHRHKAYIPGLDARCPAAYPPRYTKGSNDDLLSTPALSSTFSNSLRRHQLPLPGRIVIRQGWARRLAVVNGQIIPGAFIQVTQQLIERQGGLRVAGSQGNRNSG